MEEEALRQGGVAGPLVQKDPKGSQKGFGCAEVKASSLRRPAAAARTREIGCEESFVGVLQPLLTNILDWQQPGAGRPRVSIVCTLCEAHDLGL